MQDSDSIYGQALADFWKMCVDFGDDVMVWVSRLSDVERLIGLCAFILVLFLLVMAKSTTRRREPGKARSFASAFLLVVAFSFISGFAMDAEYNVSQYVPGNIF